MTRIGRWLALWRLNAARRLRKANLRRLANLARSLARRERRVREVVRAMAGLR